MAFKETNAYWHLLAHVQPQHLKQFLIAFRRRNAPPPSFQNANLTCAKTEMTPKYSVHSARRLRLPMETGRVPQPSVVSVSLLLRQHD